MKNENEKLNIENVSSFYNFVMENTNFSHEDFPIKFNLINNGESKVLLVIGDNAEGKSFLTSQMSYYANDKAGVKGYNIGMKARTRQGMESVFVYADESVSSTGFSTLSSVMGGVRNCIKYAKEKTPMMLLLDEPTLGLSSRYERAMGEFIAQSILENKELPDFKGIILVTHSKKLVQSMIDHGVNPTTVSIGEKFKKLEEWVNLNDDATLEELLGLTEKGNQTRRKLNAFFKGDKK